MRAVIVFAHGSRDPLWRKPVEAVAAQVQALAPDVLATCAYLELSEPTLPEAAARLVATGVTDIRVLPLFFGMGKHAREDLPMLMQSLREEYTDTRFSLLPTAGENPKLLALLATMALEDAP
jgi:sirohydrochlorin cobaltochelatase